MTITADRITVSAGGREILPPTSLSLAPGTSLALVGPSGSGKTTLLNALGMLVRVDSGRIELDGVAATAWKDARRRRFWHDQAAFIFQDYGLIDEESAAFNVVLSNPPLRPRSALRNRAALDALAAVGLAGREGERVSALSGGEKQRVGLARAIYKRARYIFADEPTASLDEANRERVTGLLLGERERGAAVLIATHDLELAKLCDHRHVLGA